VIDGHLWGHRLYRGRGTPSSERSTYSSVRSGRSSSDCSPMRRCWTQRSGFSRPRRGLWPGCTRCFPDSRESIDGWSRRNYFALDPPRTDDVRRSSTDRRRNDYAELPGSTEHLLPRAKAEPRRGAQEPLRVGRPLPRDRGARRRLLRGGDFDRMQEWIDGDTLVESAAVGAGAYRRHRLRPRASGSYSGISA